VLFLCWFTNIHTLPPGESALQGRRAAIRLAQCFDSQHYSRPHSTANASDLPATRGANVENLNANGDIATARPLMVDRFLDDDGVHTVGVCQPCQIPYSHVQSHSHPIFTRSIYTRTQDR